jgi:hypothetical protein
MAAKPPVDRDGPLKKAAIEAIKPIIVARLKNNAKTTVVTIDKFVGYITHTGESFKNSGLLPRINRGRRTADGQLIRPSTALKVAVAIEVADMVVAWLKYNHIPRPILAKGRDGVSDATGRAIKALQDVGVLPSAEVAGRVTPQEVKIAKLTATAKIAAAWQEHNGLQRVVTAADIQAVAGSVGEAFKVLGK